MKGTVRELKGSTSLVRSLSWLLLSGSIQFGPLAMAETPRTVFSTYLGTRADDRGKAVAYDVDGNLVIAAGAQVVKISPDGSERLATIPVNDGAEAMATDGSGSTLVASRGILTRYGPDGIPSYHVSLGETIGRMAVAADPQGNAYFAGSTESSNQETRNAHQPANAGLRDFYVLKVSPSGALIYATYLGGTQQDTAAAIAADAEGNAYVTGRTLSSNFPTANPLRDRPFDSGFGDAVVVKLGPSGELLYSTYWGGNGNDSPQGITVGPDGSFVICGGTEAFDFPQVKSLQRNLAGSWDAFVTRFHPSGRPVEFSTFYGGSGVDVAEAIAIGADGSLMITGETQSPEFPLKDPIQEVYGGKGGLAGDAFLLRLFPRGTGINYASYFGGASGDLGLAVAFGPDDQVAVAGYTRSTDLNLVKPIQPALSGGDDAFLLVLEPGGPRISAAGVVNAASNLGGAVAPGEIVVIWGGEIGPAELTTLQLDDEGRVAAQLGGVRALFDGVAAPLVYVSANQVSGIVPYSVAGRVETTLQIEYAGKLSNPVTLPVVAAAPAVFSTNFSGTGQGAILNQDGITPNSQAKPAEPGSIVAAYCTGEGQTVPAGVDGMLAEGPVYPKPGLPVTAEVGGLPAVVHYYGAAPLMVAGVLQVNVEIPASLASGNHSLKLRVGAYESPGGITVAVK